MLVFFGDKVYKKFGFHPHETYTFVLIALLPLGILSIIAGFFEHPFEEFTTKVLSKYELHIPHTTEMILILATSAIAISGVLFAIYKYSRGGFSKELENLALFKILKNQYFIPQFYEAVILKPYYELSKFAWKQIDIKIIDFSVDLIARVLYSGGEKSRKMQSGNLSDMLKWMVVGIVILLAFAIFYRPQM
jgi:NADH-quinone oxidoreductase subunit L